MAKIDSIKDQLLKLNTVEKHQLIKVLNNSFLKNGEESGEKSEYDALIKDLKAITVDELLTIVEDLSKQWNVKAGAGLVSESADEEKEVEKEKDSFVVELKITEGKPLEQLGFVKAFKLFKPTVSMPESMAIYKKFAEEKMYNFAAEKFDKDTAQKAQTIFSGLVTVELK